MDERGITYIRDSTRAVLAGDTTEVVTLGMGFLAEFPIAVIILVILGLFFGVTIVAGIFSLFANIYFLAILGLLIAGILLNERYFEIRAMSILILLSGLFTVIMIYLQYTSLLKTNVFCAVIILKDKNIKSKNVISITPFTWIFSFKFFIESLFYYNIKICTCFSPSPKSAIW